ncbi:hypothetical protein DKM44_13350 [Deinococcus irradiatisoli]|uniref:UPF0225 protein DKM44_13350 n=1 Tax=Deinococcus irradiatisoli TaxID=2202254 RepID=A0A2Z3JGH6_9DEIO|nr:YchJ family metal-binding protein [Deinococcus irradiatisoli]AWN24095.1 hypothetical protein DKM44_13350 [Deinococcus irradiatisoli]
MPSQAYPAFKPCPCGSRQPYAACCQPRLSGERPAETPEALMRSRYTAYVLRDAAYLQATWHPRTRPAHLQLAEVRWLGLHVRRAAGNTVSFTARYQEGRNRHELRERSTFVQEEGRWFYLDGVEG